MSCDLLIFSRLYKNNMKNNSIIGSDSQSILVEKYSRYVSEPKALFFAKLGLGVIQGERKGLYIEMLEGVKGQPPMNLIDCRTSGGVFNLGHQHPAIIQAMKDGLDAGLDIGDHHLLSEQRALLAERLAGLLPGDISKTQFCATGGEAIDLAIKLARGYTRRKKIVSATIGYHGVTGLAMSAGHSRFRDAFQWDPEDFIHIPFGDVSSLEVLNGDVAAIIMEPIPATGGILIPEKGYFRRMRELCDQNGIMLIADEVQTGLGRTGQLWGMYGGLYADEKVVPDLIVLAKGMSAGYYPMATCSYKPFIEEVFEKDPFIHISTTGGSELGCHVTRTMIDIVSADSFLENVRQMGALFKEGFEMFRDKYPELITEVRGRGLMWGIEFVDERFGLGYTVKMIENGIFADFCGNNEKVVKIMPPLIIGKEDVKLILERLDRALAQLRGGN